MGGLQGDGFLSSFFFPFLDQSFGCVSVSLA